MNNSLDKLRTIEIDILSIGDKIADLFDKIQDIYGGKSYDDSKDFGTHHFYSDVCAHYHGQD